MLGCRAFSEELVNGGATFQKSAEGGDTGFQVTPAPSPKYWLSLGLGLAMAGLAAATGLGGLIALVMWGLAILAMVAFVKDPRPPGQRAPATLRVATDRLVTTSGLTFSSADIRDLQVDNLYDDNLKRTGFALGLGRKRQLRAVSWLLRLDRFNNEQSINIACGMDHDTAENLLREVKTTIAPKVV
jgi:hypothetical protein